MSFCKFEYKGKTYTEDQLRSELDNTKNMDYFEDVHFSQAQVLPEFDNYLIYKRNLISRMKNRLLSIKRDKKRMSTDREALRNLINLEHQVEDRLIELEEELGKMENSRGISDITFYADPDIKRLKKLSESDNPKDLNEARVIINFYKAMGTLVEGVDHPLFEEDQIFDSKGNIILDQSIIDLLEGLRAEVVKEENKISAKEKTTLEAVFNNNSKIKNISDNPITYDEAFFKGKGLKDASWIDMFAMDITNGIFSTNGIVPQVMMNELQNSFNNALSYSKSIEARVEELQPKVEAILSRDYSINIPGVKGVSYELFRAVDKDGFARDNITQRYSPEFLEERGKMFQDFNTSIDKARKTEDPAKRRQKISEVYQKRNRWYKENTIVLDIRKIPEVIENADFSSFGRHFQTDATDAYSQRLKDLLGEQGYQEEVAKQIKLIEQYKTQLEVRTDSLIAEEGVENLADLSDPAKDKLRSWAVRNNPFTIVSNYYKNKPNKFKGQRVNESMAFNYSIPRKEKVRIRATTEGPVPFGTGEQTNYYDERYKIIEENEDLKEFHSLILEVQEKMLDIMPHEIREKFGMFSIPALRKSIFEILLNKNTPLLQRLSDAYREIIERIKGLFGVKPQGTLSYANVDPITGIPEYQVNSQFFKSHRTDINNRYNIELVRLKLAMGLPSTLRVRKFDTFNLKEAPDTAISLLAENVGVEPNLAAIQRRFPDMNMEQAEIGKMLRAGIEHQVVESSSFDLPKIMKLFSHLTMEYAARKEVLPWMEMAKRHYEQIKAPETTNLGYDITNKKTGKTRLEGERAKANRQMNSWFERAVLGNYGSKSEFGDTTIKRTGEFGFPTTNQEQIDSLGKKLRTNVTGRILTKDEKIIERKIDLAIEGLREELDGPDLIEGEAEVIQDRIEELQKKKRDLGKQFSFVKMFDAFFNFIRFKGLGWNIPSYVTNFMEGQIANMIVAGTGDYFTPENIYRANHIVKGSFLKNLTGFNKRTQIVTPGAKLTRILMDRYRILQDASNELQKASAKSAFTSFKSLSPYEGTRRTEYLNQAPLMISILMDIKITGVNGQEGNVWDAMNPDGTLKEEFRTEENIQNWEEAKGDQFNDFSSHTIKTIVNAHGDYDELRGNMASEYTTGKALLMFKRWMSRQIYQRFAMVPQPDLEAGIKEYKGRYLSHTAASAALHGAVLGFGGLGILGAGGVGIVVGGLAGAAIGKYFGANTGMNFLQELALLTKQLLLNLVKLPVNNITGKSTIRESIVDDLNLSDRDLKNLKANMIEISITAAWLGMMLFAKALLWDDDDEKDSTRRQAHNLLINRLMQLSSQAALYTSPDLYNSTIGSLAVVRFLNDLGKTAKEANDFVEGNDIIPTGPNAGESALYNQFSKTFYPGIMRQGIGFGKDTERQYRPSAFDSWFWNSEKKTRKNIQGRRARLKRDLKKKGLSDKEIRKELNKQLPYPKKKK